MKPAERTENELDSGEISDSTEDTKSVATAPAELSLREQIDKTPSGSNRIRLQLKLAEQLVAEGKKERALAELRDVSKTDVFDPQGFYNAGNGLARLEAFDDAINAYRKAIDQRKGKYSRALNNLGVLLMRQGRWDEAYDSFLAALKLESFHYAEASYNLGRLYSARGETDLATREWRRALRVDPEHAGAARALMNGEVGSASKGDASEASTRADSMSNYESSKRNSSVSNSERRKPALVLDAANYDFLQRARTLNESGKRQDAIEAYRRVIARAGGYFPPANLELSYILMNLNMNDEALLTLLPVAKRDSLRYPISHYYLARLYERKGDLEQAEDLFTKAAAAYEPRNFAMLLDLSRVREKRGDYKGALAALEEYGRAMEGSGKKPAWVDESLSALRLKVAGVRN